MKRNLFIFLFLTILSFSCSTDFDITADWQETAIIYGMLNKNDAVQYIRIEKAFLDENTSALKLAQVSDSIYFQDSIRVTLRRVNAGQESELTLVDGNQIGLPKDSGTFAFEPNYLYQYNQPIDVNDNYLLTVENLNNGNIYTSQTAIVKDLMVTFPPPNVDYAMNLASDGFTNIQWNSAENGKVYEMKLRFYYTEWQFDTPLDRDTLFIDWPVFTNQVSSGTGGGELMNYRMLGNEFYSFLGFSLQANTNIRRSTLDKSVQLIFTVGGQDLYEFINVNQAQTGITSLQSKPEFSNITNGLGIFSTRTTTQTELFGLSRVSLDSLSCGSKTGDLNFINVTCQ